MTSFKEVAETINVVLQDLDATEEVDRLRRNELYRIYDQMMRTDPTLVKSSEKRAETKVFLEQSIPEIAPISSLLSKDGTAEVYLVMDHPGTTYMDSIRFSDGSLSDRSIHLKNLKEYTPISLDDIPDLVLRKKVGKRIAKMRLAKMKALGER